MLLLSVWELFLEEEVQKMGCKDLEQEVEKFVIFNMQELGKDKWLCFFSGKKFKGFEFVCKYIFNKYVEKIEEVKKEVVFFNNFFIDVKCLVLFEIKLVQLFGFVQIFFLGLILGFFYLYQIFQGLMFYGQFWFLILGYGVGVVCFVVFIGGFLYFYVLYGVG